MVPRSPGVGLGGQERIPKRPVLLRLHDQLEEGGLAPSRIARAPPEFQSDDASADRAPRASLELYPSGHRARASRLPPSPGAAAGVPGDAAAGPSSPSPVTTSRWRTRPPWQRPTSTSSPAAEPGRGHRLAHACFSAQGTVSSVLPVVARASMAACASAALAMRKVCPMYGLIWPAASLARALLAS
jgi:hypothetical protein